MKNVLILGATSAIAQEFAKIYAQEKSSLFLVGRNSGMLEIISQDLKVRGAQSVQVMSHDLNDFSFHHEMIQLIFNQSKRFDIVLLAHGVLGKQSLAESETSEVLNILNSNFVSHASLLTHIAKQMISQKSGTIAVISSVAGERGKQSNYVYGSAKAGKTVFVDGLRNKLFSSGVHVLNCKLGFVDTPMTQDFNKGVLWAQPQKVAQGIAIAIQRKKNTVYLPGFWFFIMLIIRNIPEGIFKKLKM